MKDRITAGCLIALFFFVALLGHGSAQTMPPPGSQPGGGMTGGYQGHPCDRVDTQAIECCPVPDPASLHSPSRFRVTGIRKEKVYLEWDGSAGSAPAPMSCVVVNYMIDRSTDLLTWVGVGSSTAPRYVDEFAFEYRTYYYRVRSQWVCENDCRERRGHVSNPAILYASIDRILASDASSVDNRLDYRKNPTALRDYRFGYSMYKGGLFVGFLNDPSRIARLYTKFQVPEPPVHPTDGLWAATLELFYLENHEDSADFPGNPFQPPSESVTIRVHRVHDASWMQRRIRWSTAPPYSSTPTQSLQIPITTGGLWLEFPITQDVPVSGGTVSEAIVAADEQQRSWKYFARGEYRYSLAPYILRATGRLVSAE